MISIYPKKGIHTSVSYPFNPVYPQRFSQLADFIKTYTWSPIIYRGATRREVNFNHAWLVGLDFDNTKEQAMTLSQAVENVFAGMRHIIGTTKNHQRVKVTETAAYPPADRFRVILQLQAPVTSLEAYRYTTVRSIAHYNADPDAGGTSRLFHPCREIISVCDGDYEDFYQESAEDKKKREILAEIRKREADAYRLLGKDPPFIKYLMKKSVASHRNPTLYPVIRHYAELGMDVAAIEEIIKQSTIYKNNINDRQFVRGVVSSIKSAVKNHGVDNGQGSSSR